MQQPASMVFDKRQARTARLAQSMIATRYRKPRSGTFRAVTSPHQFARSVQSHLPIWQWLRRLLRVLQAAEQGGTRKMDGQAPFRATTVDPRLYGFSRYDLLHDQHLVSMTGAGKLPSHLQRSARRIATVIRSMT